MTGSLRSERTRLLPFDKNLPVPFRVTSQNLDAVEAIWNQGFAVLASRLNRLLEGLFPRSPDLRLRADSPSSNHGLQYYHRIFHQALPPELSNSVPNAIRFVQESRPEKSPTEVVLRAGDLIFPWCVGFTPLGEGGRNLDEHYQELVCGLRSSRTKPGWFEDNIVKPTIGQADLWRLLFRSWRKRLALSKPKPPENLTQAQLDIWAVLTETGHRLTGVLINKALAKKELRQSPGMLRQRLGEMVKRGTLTNRCDVTPRGYGLPGWT